LCTASVGLRCVAGLGDGGCGFAPGTGVGQDLRGLRGRRRRDLRQRCRPGRVGLDHVDPRPLVHQLPADGDHAIGLGEPLADFEPVPEIDAGLDLDAMGSRLTVLIVNDISVGDVLELQDRRERNEQGLFSPVDDDRRAPGHARQQHVRLVGDVHLDAQCPRGWVE
jgi:hypothetical protein